MRLLTLAVALSFSTPAFAETIDICNFASDSKLSDFAKDIDAVTAAANAGKTFVLAREPLANLVHIVASKDRPTFRDEALAALDKLRRTEKGRDILQQIKDRERPVRIVYAKGEDPLWLEMPGRPYSVILIDPTKIPGTIDADGNCNPTPLARALAHELGHAAGEMNEDANVIVNENLVSEELGLPPRPGYTAGCLPERKCE